MLIYRSPVGRIQANKSSSYRCLNDVSRQHKVFRFFQSSDTIRAHQSRYFDLNRMHQWMAWCTSHSKWRVKNSGQLLIKLWWWINPLGHVPAHKVLVGTNSHQNWDLNDQTSIEIPLCKRLESELHDDYKINFLWHDGQYNVYKPLDFCVCWRRFLLSAMITENQSIKRLPIAISCCGLHSVDFVGNSETTKKLLHELLFRERYQKKMLLSE